MRLIDADNFKKRHCEENCGDRKCVDSSDMCIFISELNEQPTAYDVDRVVEQIKQVHKKFCNSVDCGENQMCKDCEECIMFKKIIDIVKGGGINDQKGIIHMRYM